MLKAPGNDARAWQTLLAARRHDWNHGPLRHEDDHGTIVLAANGTHEATPPLNAAADALLAMLIPLVLPRHRGGARVVAQLGQSLDGRIATDSGASHYINGLASRTHLHRLRALVDAVLVGAGTVADDDPALTVRHVDGPQPLRAVLDPRGRLSPRHRVFQSDEAPTLHLLAAGVRPLAGVGTHVRHCHLPESPGVIAPETILATLREAGCERVLVEGGSATVSRFVEADALDRLHVMVAPLLIGSGRPGLTLPAIASLDQARRPPWRYFALGEDVLFDLDLRAAAP